MRLLTYSRYGTRMVLDIAVHGRKGPVQMSDIARRQGISQKYLERIIRILKDAGIITSVRGPKGGHLLARSPEDISIGDILRALEGDCELVHCLKDDEVCPQVPGCLTRMIWKEGSRAMFKRFDEMRLSELIGYHELGIKFGDSCEAIEASMREQEMAEEQE